jgi:hypothetical protein
MANPQIGKLTTILDQATMRMMLASLKTESHLLISQEVQTGQDKRDQEVLTKHLTQDQVPMIQEISMLLATLRLLTQFLRTRHILMIKAIQAPDTTKSQSSLLMFLGTSCPTRMRNSNMFDIY